jgi:PAS domain S-box-containing protein
MINDLNDPELLSPAQRLLPFFLFVLAASGLYASSLYSYLLFHSLIEVLHVVVLLTIFVLAWNARTLLDNHYILFLGISFLFVAAFTLIHMFAYKGFGVFPGEDANLSTQLWIASRYVFSLSFLIAPVFITRRLNVAATLIVFAVLTVSLFTAIFSGVFPDCFIEGQGLTPFKIYSEYITIVILMASLGLLIRKHALFDPRVLWMVAFSIVSTAAANAAFTQYFNVYGQANLVGHFFLFLSSIMIYWAIVVTGIQEPMAIIFRNLEQSKEQCNRMAETSVDLIFQLDIAGKVVFCSPAIVQYGYNVADVIGKDFSAYIAHDDLERATSAFRGAIGGRAINAFELRLLRADGTPYHAEINVAPLVINGTAIGLQGVSRDVTSRKKADEALRESEERYRELVQNANSAIIRWEKNGTLSFFNEYAQAFFGYCEDEILGKNVNILLPQQESSGIDLSKLVQNIVDNPELYKNNENENVCRDGRRVWMSWTNKPIFDGKGNVIEILAIGNDITARKQMEKLLQRSETRYRDLAESIPAMLWAANVQGVVVDYNCRWYEYSGQNAEQSYGEGWSEIIHPDDVQRVDNAWSHCIQTGEDYSIEYRLRRVSDGTYRWHLVQAMLRKDQQGNPLNWFGACIDIEDRKRAENALWESEERLRMVLQACSIGTFELNFETGKGQWNSVEYELLGLKPEEARNHQEVFFKSVHPDDVEALKAEWEDALQFGELDTEFRILRADGQERWLAGKGRFLNESEDDHQVTRFLGVNFDITDRKHAEEQIKASLAEKEVMLREIHHRVKNNLQVISSLVSLQTDNLTDERIREEFNDVRDRVRAMALVHEKLYQTDNMAQLNFAEYVTTLLHFLWHSHGALARKVRLLLGVEPVALPIETAVPCGLILNELVGNALKHAFPDGSGGEVTVGLDHDHATETICLRVCDNGIGLRAGLDWRQTSSLGLRLVRILAGQLRGTVEPGTGPGTEFRVTFPLKGLQS